MNHLDFVDEYGSFAIHKPENISYLYFPLAAETGLKSSITPNLGGDAKIDQETFLLEPVSAENLHNNRAVRNFWLVDEDGQVFSAAGASAEQEAARFTSAQDDSSITAGLMWQTLQRTSAEMGLRTGITAFCPRQDNVEILCVTVQNQDDQPHQLTPVAAIPLYGRSADNIRDHRNVTSMLHRIWTTENGVMVRPTMSFDERGHRPNHKVYYVSGFGPDGQKPEAFYPTVEAFLGEGGTYLHPRAVYEQYPGVGAGSRAEGREAMGAFRFPAVTLDPGQEAHYVLMLGVEDSEEAVQAVWSKYHT